MEPGSQLEQTYQAGDAAERQVAGSAHKIRKAEQAMSGSVTDPVVRRVQVQNKAGLHARPAMMLSMAAKEFASEIELVLADVPPDHHLEVGTRADAKNSIELISLGAPCGTALDIEAIGSDADEAVEKLVELFVTSFGLPND